MHIKKHSLCLSCGNDREYVYGIFCEVCDRAFQDWRNSINEEFVALKKNAGKLLYREICHGSLKRAAEFRCVDCGREAQGYDHRDYSKPLDVQPVCRSCNHRRGSALPLVRGGWSIRGHEWRRTYVALMQRHLTSRSWPQTPQDAPRATQKGRGHPNG